VVPMIAAVLMLMGSVYVDPGGFLLFGVLFGVLSVLVLLLAAVSFLVVPLLQYVGSNLCICG